MSIVADSFLHTLAAAPVPGPVPPVRAPIQRQLRAAAEHLLWRHLRDSRLAGARFRRQHLIDCYLADFYCPEARLVIELDSTLTPALSAHADARRAYFRAKGLEVLRLRDRDVIVETRAVLGVIRSALVFGQPG